MNSFFPSVGRKLPTNGGLEDDKKRKRKKKKKNFAGHSGTI